MTKRTKWLYVVGTMLLIILLGIIPFVLFTAFSGWTGFFANQVQAGGSQGSQGGEDGDRGGEDGEGGQEGGDQGGEDGGGGQEGEGGQGGQEGGQGGEGSGSGGTGQGGQGSGSGGTGQGGEGSGSGGTGQGGEGGGSGQEGGQGGQEGGQGGQGGQSGSEQPPVLRDITVRTQSASKMYDGTALMVGSVTVVAGELAEGHYLASVHCSALTEVGIEDNIVQDLTILDEMGRNVTSQYNITYEYGTLEVLYCTITVETGSASKLYDGEELRCEEFTVNGLPDGFYVEVVFSGTQTLRGRSENTVGSVTVYDKYGNDVTANFAVEIINGILKVN